MLPPFLECMKTENGCKEAAGDQLRLGKKRQKQVLHLEMAIVSYRQCTEQKNINTFGFTSTFKGLSCNIQFLNNRHSPISFNKFSELQQFSTDYVSSARHGAIRRVQQQRPLPLNGRQVMAFATQILFCHFTSRYFLLANLKLIFLFVSFLFKNCCTLLIERPAC